MYFQRVKIVNESNRVYGTHAFFRLFGGKEYQLLLWQ